jgi:hypothetical protein
MLSGRGSMWVPGLSVTTLRGETWPREEVRDGTHVDNRRCGNRCGIARIAASLGLGSLSGAEFLRAGFATTSGATRLGTRCTEQIERRVRLVHVQRQPL